MNLVAKILLGVGGTGATAASSYGIYEFIRPKNIAEKLLWEGKILLNTEESNTTDDGEWDQLVNKHKTASSDQISNLGLDTTASSGKEEDNRKKLKAKCKEILQKNLSETDSETNLNNARFWCIKNSSKLTTTPPKQ